MSRTGSTYARKWPTSWGPKLRLALLAGTLLVATSAAHAEWKTRDVPGTPNDVQVWAPENFSVTTSQGAYLFQDGGVSQQVLSTQAVGARLRSTGCFEVFLKGDTITSSPAGCAIGNIFGSGSYELSRVRTTESGAAYVLAKQQTQQMVEMAFSPTESARWGPTSKPQFLGSTVALGVLGQGNSEQALFAVGKPGEADLYWYVDGVQQGRYVLTDTSPAPKDIQAIDVFPAGDPNPTALFGWAGKLYRGTLVSGNQPSFSPVPLPMDPVTVTGVDVNTGAGSVNGDGFGMATVQYDGGVALLSAVPASQPQDIGRQWRVNPSLPLMTNAPRYLACQGAQFCVMAQNAPPPGNLLVYANTSPPTFNGNPNTSVPESKSSTFVISASDPDGDPVGMKVMPDTISAPELSMTSSTGDGWANLVLSAGAVCKDTSFAVTVTATDGLTAHDQPEQVSIQVLHTQPGPAPGISPSANIVVQSGGPSAALKATAPPTPPCLITDYRWTAVTPSAPQALGRRGERHLSHAQDSLPARWRELRLQRPVSG